jgi:hypothetical protein
VAQEAHRRRVFEATSARGEAQDDAQRADLAAARHEQAAFLVFSLRARLLALPAKLAPRIVKACAGGDQRAIESLIDAEVRDALDEIAQMPQRVTDPHWLEKLDERNEATSP